MKQIPIKTLQFCVYKITNSISGKSYIGKTCNIENRWNGHLARSKNTEINNKFPNAIRKYPEDTWNISILYETDDEKHSYEVEAILIDEYDSFHNGYNSCGGGIGFGSGENHPMFGRTGENHPMFGKTFTRSEETKKKLSIAMSGENNPMFDTHRPKELKKKLSIAMSGKNHPMFGSMPWNNSACKSRGLEINWFYLDKVYDLRIKYGYGPKYMFETLISNNPNLKKSPTSFQNMFRWFEKNGNPSKNKDWLDFHNIYIN